MKHRIPLIVLTALMILARVGRAGNEIGFIEKFALAADREEVLGQLVPGSEEYYFFHALEDQNSGQKEKLKAIMEQWAARFPQSAQRRVIENREALMGYERDPKATLALLRERLHLHFDDEQEARDQKPNLPSALEPGQIDRAAFEKQALVEGRDDLSKFGDGALEELVRGQAKLNPAQRRALLGRLRNPDLPHLVEMVEADLGGKESRGFGEYPIHEALMAEQLDELALGMPSLYENLEFVQARLEKMRPGADVDVEAQPAEHEAWLERLWGYVKNLSGSMNTLKAHLLFQRLELDRRMGVWDKGRLLEYLKLPRRAAYVNPGYLKKAGAGIAAVDFGAELSRISNAPPIGHDEWLVREYLLRLLAVEPSWEPWAEYLREGYVKPLFAEAKIVNGIGDPEQWASLLGPAGFEALKERVDLDFSAGNAAVFAPREAVSLKLSVKNAAKLVVRIYELNALSFFSSQNRQLNTDLNLEGLIANTERTQSFEDAAARSPFRRAERVFEFPELKGKRGAWIVEFIGGGKSSRALIRKGQWQVLEDTGAAGDELTVVDEDGQQVRDAAAWAEGRRYAAQEKSGRIVVPFSNQAGRRPLVVASASGDFACLTTFERHAEAYRLDAQFQIDREELLAGREATLAVRAGLLAGSRTVAPGLILEPALTIVSTTQDGIKTTRKITAAEGLKLDAAKLYLTTLATPERLAQLTATLSGKVENLSGGGEKNELSATQTWTINGMDETEATEAGHLVKAGGKYVFELLGKDGEAEADRQVVFTFRHREFQAGLSVALATDAHGRIALGALKGIEGFGAQASGRALGDFVLPKDAALRPAAIHAKAGETISAPWFGSGPLTHDAVSLLEKRGEAYLASRFEALSLEQGFLKIKGIAAGDYELILRADGERSSIPIRVSSGAVVDEWIVSEGRHLQAPDPAPLQIESVNPSPEAITIQIRNANPFTRVHVVADHFVPERPMAAALSGFSRFAPERATPARRPNLFVSGRAIGDEYRYILERRYTKAYPGNMLARPGLLLDPWEVRSTDQAGQLLQEAEALKRAAGDREAKPAGAAPAPMPTPYAMEGTKAGAEANLDFLDQPSPAVYNLVPDRDGVVRIDRQALGDRHYLQVYAEDLSGAVWRSLDLPETAVKTRDLRLSRALDPQTAFTESKQITKLSAGRSITLAEALGADLETYDSLAAVYALFSTLSNDATLAKFAFVLEWPKLKEDEKRAKYSEFACHELNFFLSRKDPEFFKAVVQPYLRNKKDKTFMDEYLLESDLHRYLEPWAHARLNVAERALLGRRIPGEAAASARHLRELWSMVPAKPETEDLYFETALHEQGLLADRGDGVVTKSSALLSDLEKAAPLANSAPVGGELRTRNLSDERLVELQQQVERAPLAKGALAYEAFGKQSTDARGEQVKKYATGIARDVDKDAFLNERTWGMMDAASAAKQRGEVRQFFRRIGPTKEWAENNYYQLPLARQDAALIPIGAFWRDYAEWDGQAPFLSEHLAEASRNFSEAMLALSVLDLPFEAPKNQTLREKGRYTLTAGGALLAFHKELAVAAPAEGRTELLVSENFFRRDDRYRMEENERFDKYVTEEFLCGVVYGGNVVVTNPSSSPQKISVLVQIPQGALPALGSKATQSKPLRLEAYATQTLEYFFYFPAPGAEPFVHYPAHVSQNGKALGGAKPLLFKVVGQLSKVDTASWEYVSQYGSEAEVFAYLAGHNLQQIDLVKAAWRVRRSVDFFRKLVAVLEQRHVYNDVIYSYAVLHDDAGTLREWLRHHEEFLGECGPVLETKLLRIDPIERRAYEHLEYAPLINQRVHRLGGENRIVNPVMRAQYQSLLTVLAYEQRPTPMDQMSVVYHLFLQDRVEEALARFEGIAAEGLPTRIQYDYFRCYAAFYEEQLAQARGIASQYVDYPVERWRKLFAGVLGQLDEIEGRKTVEAAGKEEDKRDREAQQSGLAESEPSFEFKIENHHVALSWKNLTEVTINYYPMDPEFLFSSSPFVTQDAGRFSIIEPGKSVRLALPAGQDATEVALPAEYERANVLVEILGAGQRKAEAYHANTLKLAVVENYGRLEVRDAAAGKPVAKAYVKVYARLKDGQIRFYKDGYSDLRGKFDYASLNTGAAGAEEAPPSPRAPAPSGFDYQMLRPRELGEVERFSILVVSEANGAEVKEAAPPAE